MTFEGKKILLFSQFFFGYEEKIKAKLQTLGASVDLFDEMSVKKPFERALLKVSPALFRRKTEKYYQNILDGVKDTGYDYVVFIDCEMPTETVLERYRNSFPDATFCLYLWDSVANLKGIDKKFRFFHHISTFDRDDAARYGMAFRPLFFTDEYRAQGEDTQFTYDLAFIGTIHSDRYRIIRQLAEDSELKVYVYPYLQSWFIYYFYKLTKKEFRRSKFTDFQYKKLDAKTIVEITHQSRAILDIQHPNQTGLTMRTLEVLGLQKKLLTTNQQITQYDFYNENNIMVIDRNAPRVRTEFFHTPYEKTPADVYERYSIDSWLRGVLGVDRA